MPGSFRIPHSAFRIGLAAALLLSLGLAFFLAHRLAASPIDVGLDLSAPLGQAPRLVWGPRGEESSPMRPVPLHSRARGVAVRYHAQVPRRALAGLRLLPAGLPLPVVRRFYVGALWPVIFAGDRSQGTAPETNPEKGLRLRDLAPLESGRPLPLPAWTAAERGGALTVLLLFILLGAFFFLLLAALRAGFRFFPQLLRAPYPDCPLSPPRPRFFLLFFLVFAGVWLFYLACFYPAAMSNDSLGQWEQIQTGRWNDYHPALHTLTMGLIARVWNSPAAVALTQVFLLAAALAGAFSFALRLPIPRAAVAAAVLTAALSPRNGNMAIILWKDVWYAAAILLLTVLLARLALDPRARTRTACWIAAGVLIALIPLYRHNGLVVLLGMWIVLPLAFWPSRRLALLAVGVSLLVFAGVRGGLYPALRVYLPPAGENVARFCNQRLSPLVMQDVPLAPEEADFLNRVHPLDRTWFSDFGPNDFAFAHLTEYRDLFFSLARRYPLLELDRFRELTDFAWRPWRRPGQLALTTYVLIAPNTLGLEQRPLLPAAGRRMERLIATLTDARWDWLGWRPAIHLYLALGAAALLWRRTRNPRLLAPFAPAALNTLSLLLASPSPDYRYQFPLTLCLGFLCCLALTRRA